MLLVILIAIIGFFAYTAFSPSAKSLGPEIDNMEYALENNFNCNINSTQYSLVVWNHKLAFGMAEDSKHALSEEEAIKYLTANFPSFKYIDEFQIE